MANRAVKSKASKTPPASMTAAEYLASQLSEDDIQAACVAYLRQSCPDVLFFKINNENRWSGVIRSLAGQKRGGEICGRMVNSFKKLGYRAGAPDFLMFWPSGGTALIEFKDADGGLTKSQEEAFPILQGLGTVVHIVRSRDEFIALLQTLGVPSKWGHA